ncbi:hypothetical protein [Mesorhizobium sp.]|uniref:hypothetical protein n=1 Tax=Mesorhizobium sp. TaxID=1871066 RepID=UPI0011FAB8EC|nr:hypothetical protein [Mesorhizobium sp.]TIS44618.1 MAG: hypothetical protein E5W96_35420 [Mesorhizobium sp.]
MFSHEMSHGFPAVEEHGLQNGKTVPSPKEIGDRYCDVLHSVWPGSAARLPANDVRVEFLF